MSIALVLGCIALSVPVAEPVAWAGPAPVKAEAIVEGVELVAVRDVTLRQATIAKGSRVKVRRVVRKNGRPVAVSLELADGHVLRRVAYRVVERNFRVAK